MTFDLNTALGEADHLARLKANSVAELDERQESILTLGLECRRLRGWLMWFASKAKLDLTNLGAELLTDREKEMVLLGGQLAHKGVGLEARQALGGDPSPEWGADDS